MNILIKIKNSKSFFGNLLEKKILISSIVAFIIFFFFIYIIQPAGIFNMGSETHKLILILLLGANYSIIFFFQTKRINQTPFSMKRWGIILISFGLISVITSIIILYFSHPFMTKNFLFRYLFTSISIITVFQIISFYILKPQLNTKKHSNETKYYTFYDNKTTLKISAEQLLFIKASGNYAEIFEINRVHLIRSTLKNILEKSTDSDLFRSHKSYLVNKNKIQVVIGNKRGYKIKLKDYHDYLPISKNSAEELKKFLKK